MNKVIKEIQLAQATLANAMDDLLVKKITPAEGKAIARKVGAKLQSIEAKVERAAKKMKRRPSGER